MKSVSSPAKKAAHIASRPGSDASADRDEAQPVAGGQRRHGSTSSQSRSTNIIEVIDVGVPVRVAYNAWTEFADFPSFLKKVRHVEQQSETKVTWQAQG